MKIYTLFATSSLVALVLLSFVVEQADAFVKGLANSCKVRPQERVSIPQLHAKKAAKKTTAKKSAAKKSAATKVAPENFRKADFVASVAEKTGMSKTEAEMALNAVVDTITEQVALGKKISLVGFGSFQAKDRAARVGRNPQTGEEIQIKASRAPTFSAGKAFKEKLNPE